MFANSGKWSFIARGECRKERWTPYDPGSRFEATPQGRGLHASEGFQVDIDHYTVQLSYEFKAGPTQISHGWSGRRKLRRRLIALEGFQGVMHHW